MASISNKDIAKAIYQSLKGKSGSSLKEATLSVRNFLIKKRLLSRWREIQLSLEKVANQEEGILQVDIYGKQKPNEKEKITLARLIKNKYGDYKINFREHIDERLLAGWRLEVEDEVIDLTLKNKLNKLQAHLTRNI